VKFLLDTNICIAVMKGHPQAVSRLMRYAPGECGISSVTAYELFTGVAKCRDPQRERVKISRLLSRVPVVPFDEPAAEHSAHVRATLEVKGMTCGPYDLLLAGHALALGLTFATNNVAEFLRVGGLAVEDWMA
jgi:tRNA(fMet)-specific endonuclease VapC